MKSDLKHFLVSERDSLRSAMERIEQNTYGIVLLVDKARRLIATVTDGDIRRAILDGVTLDDPAERLKGRRPASPYPKPITASKNTPRNELLRIMRTRRIRHLPLLDEDGRVTGIATSGALLPESPSSLRAVVMAGGFGTRLRPLTDDLPKPMLPIDGRPLLEHTIGALRRAGIRRVVLTTHYKKEKISEHFGNGDSFGVHIDYVPEEVPLGTAGALAYVPQQAGTLLVMNGDLLANINFKAMHAFHKTERADLTVGVRPYEVEVPYGVIESEGPCVKRLSEKPACRFLVNAGVYLLESAAHSLIPHAKPFDMTDLITRLLECGGRVAGFPILGHWLDIGQHTDYRKARRQAQEWGMAK